jgi:Abnormal spindle-like microcephaly-assoc'd, ASPM-SPD-2-Hydin/Beta-propeller repeat
MKLGIRTAKFTVITAAGVVLLSFLYFAAIRKNTSSSHKNTTAPPRGSNGDTPRWEKAYAQLPMGFEENRGQAARDVKFVSHGSGYALSLAPQEIDIALLRHRAMTASPLHRAAALRALREARKAMKTTVIRMQLDGANPSSTIAAEEPLPGKSNYFIGNNREKWVTDVPSYARVKYSGIYPGVDVEFYGNQRHLEYDFTVAPGADPKSIALKIEGAQRLGIDSHGDLILHTTDGDAKFQKPVVYQMLGAERREVAANYALASRNRVTFAVAKYDQSLPLVIDPLLTYSTFLGGTGEETGFGIAVDASGDAFVGGLTTSADFPTTSTAFQSTALLMGGCGFVTEIDPAGAHQLYSTYLCGATAGGSGNFDEIFGIAVDTAGKVYVTGNAFSTDFPTVNGLTTPTNNVAGSVFISKLDPSASGAASLLYSTFFGGLSGSFGAAIAVDNSGNAYVGGQTFSDPGTTASGTFPITSGAFQPALSSAAGNAFLTRIDTTKSGDAGLIYSTYLGGNGANSNVNPPNNLGFGEMITGVVVDTSNNAYVTGETSSTGISFPTSANAFQGSANPSNLEGGAFVTRIDTTKANAASLVYSTYLEGSTFDAALGIALGPNNVAYVTGSTNSLDFPTTTGAFQTTGATSGVALITLIDTTMTGNSSVTYSTFFGGTGSDTGFGIQADGNGNAYVVGTTGSVDFPITPFVLPSSLPNSFGSPFVLKLSPKGNGLADRIYASYFGGSGDGNPNDPDQGNAIAIDAHGNAYITGSTFSSILWPITPGAFQSTLNGASDAFVAKLPLLLSVVVSPANVDFGTQLVGATTASQTVTLTNNNSTALAITSVAVVAITPPAAGTDFAIVPGGTCGASLAAGASCTVSVAFTPSVASAESAELVFTDTDPTPQFATLTGTGTANAPVVVLTPTSLDFGSQLVTTASSPAKTIMLKNNGNLVLNIASITSSGDFAETNTCGASLAAGMTCTISVTFTPTATGARAGTITITDNANGSPRTVPLTGTGSDFTVTAQASVTVPRRSSQMFNVTVTPVSGFNQAVALTCTGAPVKTTCALNPTSVTPDGTNPITSQVTVTSMGFLPSVPKQPLPPSNRQILLFAMGLALLAMVFAARRLRTRIGLAGAMLVVFAVAGCGGGGGGPVTATLTLTGTVGTVSRSTTVALTVQ